MPRKVRIALTVIGSPIVLAYLYALVGYTRQTLAATVIVLLLGFLNWCVAKFMWAWLAHMWVTANRYENSSAAGTLFLKGAAFAMAWGVGVAVTFWAVWVSPWYWIAVLGISFVFALIMTITEPHDTDGTPYP